MALATDPKNEMTPREKELMALAWLCFSEKPKVDYKKLATLAGMSNPVSASNAWAKIQKKITASASDAAAGSNSATPEVQTPKATPAKKRGAAKAAADGETPAKKARTPKKATKVKEEQVDEDAVGSDVEGENGEAFF